MVMPKKNKLDKPMAGTFPTVTQREEAELLKAGYAPVLRWVRTSQWNSKAFSTNEALALARRRSAKEARVTPSRAG